MHQRLEKILLCAMLTVAAVARGFLTPLSVFVSQIASSAIPSLFLQLQVKSWLCLIGFVPGGCKSVTKKASIVACALLPHHTYNCMVEPALTQQSL